MGKPQDRKWWLGHVSSAMSHYAAETFSLLPAAQLSEQQVAYTLKAEGLLKRFYMSEKLGSPFSH